MDADNRTADQLEAHYGHWEEHPAHPLEDWETEVINGDTRLGYWEWVVVQLEGDRIDRESNENR